MRDILIEHDSYPDIIARIGETLGLIGINIEGLCLVTHEGMAIIHLVVEDTATAQDALENANIKIKGVSEVYVLHKDKMGVTGKPGSFGEICRAFSKNGVKIKFGYPAENNRFIFGVDDISKARALVE